LAAEPGVHVWNSTLRVADHPCLGNAEPPIVGASGYLDVIVAAAAVVAPGPATVRDIRFHDALALMGQASIQVDARPTAPDAHRVRVLGRDAGAQPWTVLAEGVVAPCETTDDGRDSGSDPAVVAARVAVAGPEVRVAWTESAL